MSWPTDRPIGHRVQVLPDAPPKKRTGRPPSVNRPEHLREKQRRYYHATVKPRKAEAADTALDAMLERKAMAWLQERGYR